MNKIVIPTGYMGSGSSALTDLIGEFKGYETNNGSFEYVFLHCPNGLFDLEDKLLIGNNAIRSDEALHSFRSAMMELYSNIAWWPANYKKNLSLRFMEIVDAFLDNLIDFRSDGHWYYQEKLPWNLLIQRIFTSRIRRVTKGKINLADPLLYKGMTLSFVSRDDFYRYARSFLRNLFIEMGGDEHNLLLDQLLLPFNTWRMENYFDDNAECFVVRRDPRDVFLLNKYIWTKQGDPVPFPTDVDAFCVYYEKLRQAERPTGNKHVHDIFFEDLVYRYDEAVNRILRILDLSPSDHIDKFRGFDPKRSIENTQLFNLPFHQEEGTHIKERLREYVYDFPFEREPQQSAMF